MRTKLFFIIFLTICFITSCEKNRKNDLVLSKAQQYIETTLDSALIILKNDINKEQLTARQHALWCLLVTKANDKNYISHTSDSLINIALEYFEESGEEDILMEVYYYLGRVNHDMNNVLRAQNYYLKALEAEQTSDNYKLLARINYNISYLYLFQDVYELAFEYQKKTLHYAELCNDSIAQSYTLRDIARSFSVQNNLDSAIIYYERALAFEKSLNIGIFNELSGVYLRKQEYENAHLYAQKALELIPENCREKYTNVLLNYGKINLELNKLDSAAIYIEQAQKSKSISTKANAFYYLYKLANNAGDNEMALKYMEKYKLLTDSINSDNNANSLRRTQALYNYFQTEKEIDNLKLIQLKSLNSKYRAWCFTITSMVLVALLIFLLSYVTKQYNKRRKELELKLSELELDTKSVIKNNIVKIGELEKSIIRSENEIVFLVNENNNLKERQKQWEEASDELKKTDIYKKYHLAVHKKDFAFINSSLKQELIDAIEKLYPDFSVRILQKCPSIGEDELYLCYLCKANINSPSVLSSFLHISSNSITMKRNRLFQKLFNQQGDRKKFEEFINSL